MIVFSTENLVATPPSTPPGKSSGWRSWLALQSKQLPECYDNNLTAWHGNNVMVWFSQKVFSFLICVAFFFNILIHTLKNDHFRISRLKISELCCHNQKFQTDSSTTLLRSCAARHRLSAQWVAVKGSWAELTESTSWAI